MSDFPHGEFLANSTGGDTDLRAFCRRCIGAQRLPTWDGLLLLSGDQSVLLAFCLRRISVGHSFVCSCLESVYLRIPLLHTNHRKQSFDWPHTQLGDCHVFPAPNIYTLRTQNHRVLLPDQGKNIPIKQAGPPLQQIESISFNTIVWLLWYSLFVNFRPSI